MSTELQSAPMAPATVETVLVGGDLAKLAPAERLAYYRSVCESLGLNPLTRPFEYIVLNGRLTLYARRDAADQLRRIHGISIVSVSRETIGDLHVVTACAEDRHGRRDSDVGAVSIAGLRGEALANALMKATTKAKRRVTLSLCGLGWLDETEVESVPGAQPVQIDDSGEVRTGAGNADALREASARFRRAAEAAGFDVSTAAARRAAFCEVVGCGPADAQHPSLEAMEQACSLLEERIRNGPAPAQDDRPPVNESDAPCTVCGAPPGRRHARRCADMAAEAGAQS